MEDDQNEQGLEKPEEIIDDIENILDNLHAKLVVDVTEIGQARDSFKAIKPYWAKLGETSTDDSYAADVYTSGVHALLSVRDDIKYIADQYPSFSGLMGTIYPSTDFVVSATDSTASIVLSRIVIAESDWLKPIEVSKRDKTRDCLHKMDPSLAETYEGIWEILYGTRSDPERGSLYMIRQVFDHFFNILAPDEKVKESEFWHPKNGPDPNQVTRKERLEYSAQTYIKNQTMSKRLFDSTKHMLDVYEALNKAHKRGTLGPERARSALKEMNSIIESWVEGLFFLSSIEGES